MVSIKTCLNYNFYKTYNTQSWNSNKVTSKPNVNHNGNKILRFKKPFNNSKINLIKEEFNTNANLVQFKSIFALRLSLLGSWLRAESFTFIKSYFIKVFVNSLWGVKKSLAGESITASQLKLIPSLVYTLKFISKSFQFYFTKLSYLHFGGLSYLSQHNYWNSSTWTKSILSHFNLGSLVNRVSYRNKKYSFAFKKPSIILSKGNKWLTLELPSKRVAIVERRLTTASLNGAFSPNTKLKEQLGKKASSKFYSNRKPFVNGKSMNVFDRPNGGFKHSSKLLKTFKGKRILK